MAWRGRTPFPPGTHPSDPPPTHAPTITRTPTELPRTPRTPGPDPPPRTRGTVGKGLPYRQQRASISILSHDVDVDSIDVDFVLFPLRRLQCRFFLTTISFLRRRKPCHTPTSRRICRSCAGEEEPEPTAGRQTRRRGPSATTVPTQRRPKEYPSWKRRRSIVR